MLLIRKAVAAIVRHSKNTNQFLLVHKVMRMNGVDGPVRIPGEWGFPAGGVLDTETDLFQAIMRELSEETGSTNYKLVRQFEKKLSFTFSTSLQQIMGYKGQSMTFFLVDYIGDGTDIKPQDQEIDEIKFFSKEEVIEKLHHKNDRKYFESIFL